MLTQLRYFQAIVDHGSLTGAAQALGVSQPALTRSLQALEFQLDSKLLERRSGVLRLTPAGEVLLRRGRTLLAEHRSILEDVQAVESDRELTVFINGSPMTAVALIARIVERMTRTHPDLRVSVLGDNGMNYDWKLEAIISGELDVALTLYDPTARYENLTQQLLFEPDLAVIVGRDHWAASRPDIRLEDLLDERWIFPPSSSSPRKLVENEFVDMGLALPRNLIEVSDWRITLDLIDRAGYVTAIPFHPACFDDQLSRFARLPISFPVRPLALGALYRTLSAQRPATRAVIEAALDIVREHPPL